MNDQSQMMSQMSNPVQSQMMNPMNNPVQSQMMNQNPVQILSQMNHPPPPTMNQHPVQPLMMNRTYNPWQQQQPPMKPNFSNSKPNRSNWKGKKVNSDNNNNNKKQQQQQRKIDPRRLDNNNNKPMANSSVSSNAGGTVGYNPPTLHELQSQNRIKARKFYPKKKFNNRFAPYAPRNTTSFIIRAKKAGGIASLVSPCPVTPAVLPTPIFSPSREVLGDMAKEEWGVDGYGSMKGLIRLRNEIEVGHDEEEEEDGNGSSESDVEEHVEVERRLDHDLSRFEMIYPSYGGGGGGEYNNVLENRVDDQDSHIAQLEEENLTLKERLFLMERELGDLRRRLQFLERRSQVVVVEDVNEEVVENESENDSSDNNNTNNNNNNNNNNNINHDNNREAMVEYVSSASGNERNADGVGGDVCMEEFVVPDEAVAKVDDESKDGDGRGEATNVVGKDDTDESKGKEILGNECKGGEEMNIEQHRMVAEEKEE